MREAFTFLVAAAWAKLFDDLFMLIVGETTHILMTILHAVMFTLLAVVVTIVFESDRDEQND